MKKCILSFLLILFIFIMPVMAQSVTNVQVRLENNKVVVDYALQGGKFYNHYTISLFVSLDDGSTFQGPLKEVNGAVGKNIRRGRHSISWDAMKELPVADKGFVFDVRAEVFEDDMKRSFFIAYSGNTITPLGLKVGMLGKLGWYAEFRASMSPFNSATYVVKDGEFRDYDKPGYYAFNGKDGYSAFSAVAGITYQAARQFYLYAGAGYGKEEFHWQIDDYTYEPEEKTGESWVKDDATSVAGFELDAGGILRFNKFLITAGGSTINGKVFNWTAGLGIAF